MLKALIIAAALSAAVPAHAKMVCGPRNDLGIQSCSDEDETQKQWVQLYCTAHPTDPDCAALGWHYKSDDPVDQKIDQHEVAEFCAANPTFARCVSPFEVQRREQRENHEPTATRPECPAGTITADCVISPKPGTHECPAGYSWVESMQACNDD